MQQQTGLVSILISSYNRPKGLQKAVESVLSQTYNKFEAIILDDNSNEETVDVIHQLMFKDERIKLIRSDIKEDERYISGARYAIMINEGLKIVRGQFITYLTDDDFYLPRRLEVMVNTLNANKHWDVVFGRQRLIGLDPNGKEQELGVRQCDETLVMAACRVDHNSVMHRYSCVEIVGNWPIENWGAADADYWAKLNSFGFLFYPIKEITDVKVIHSQSIQSKLSSGRFSIDKQNEL